MTTASLARRLDDYESEGLVGGWDGIINQIFLSGAIELQKFFGRGSPEAASAFVSEFYTEYPEAFPFV
jgi:hypothetical protein